MPDRTRTAAIARAALFAWPIATFPASAQTGPVCVPASDSICKTVGAPEFAAAYRNAAAGGIDPDDAVDDVRANLRRAMLGAGQESAGAIGRQVDAVLDDALARAQRRMCGAGASPEAALAGGLTQAAAARGTRLGAAVLGAMTGAVVGAAGGHGAACLCAARSFDAIRRSCAGRCASVS